MNTALLAADNTLLREALKRIAAQLEPGSWDTTSDAPINYEAYMARLPHLRQFALDMAEDVNKRPGFKEYVYESA
jgi:hypothetical protein